MSAMEKLRAACQKKTFKSFKSMEVGQYFIDRFSLVETVYGKRVRVDMEESYMFLPERIFKLVTEADIDELNSATPKIMIFSGRDGGDQSRILLDFVDIPSLDVESLKK